MMLIVCIIDIQCLCSLQYYNYVCGNVLFCFFFFKQKTAYEMRISDWSSDVCSSDLEKRPLDEQIAAIQARYNVYIAPLKNKQPGSVSKAVAALGSLLTVWLNKLEAEKQEREQAAREAHEKAQQEAIRSEEHTSELQSLMRISYAVFCLKKKKKNNTIIQLLSTSTSNT